MVEWNSSDAAEIEGAIAHLERQIQGANSQVGRKGEEKRAQIPELRARISQYRDLLGSMQPVEEAPPMQVLSVQASAPVGARPFAAQKTQMSANAAPSPVVDGVVWVMLLIVGLWYFVSR